MPQTTDKPKSEVSEPSYHGDLGWLLARTSHVLSTELTRAFEGLGIAPRGHCVLSAALDGEFTQKQLADMIGLDKTTMVVTVDELEQRGYAERRPSTTDRRARIIAVTPAGRKVLAKGRKLAAEIENDVLSALPASERRALVSGLERLAGDRLATPTMCSRAPRRRA